MAALTDGYENELLDGLTGVSPLTTPTTVYLALFTADPTDTGSVVNEYQLNGCARVSIAAKFPAATGTAGSVSNTVQIDFVTATGDWTQITHIGYMKTDVEGTADMMVHAQLDSPITILNGQTFSFAIGTLTITAA